MNLSHRKLGWKLMRGKGLEIGALHEHTILPTGCDVDYADAISKEEAKKLFPEIDGSKLVDVKYIIDLDKSGLKSIGNEVYDFVILSHVIEHVANPINVVDELFRVCKKGGLILIAAPDKNYTFDRKRDLTPFAHLWSEYEQKVTEVTDDHYLDFIKGVHPEVLEKSEAELQQAIISVKNRREHAHVWDSGSFQQFLLTCFEKLGIHAQLVMENIGEHNKLEYFSIWQKTDGVNSYEKPQHSLVSKIRLAIGV
ncbi:MAG: methyltransferase domain-containing protein [Bacteroidota bacterium]